MTIDAPLVGARLAGSSPTTEPFRILKPGRNCWTIARAGRAALLPDAATYFGRLDQILHKARRQILIVGWDFDGRIELCPHDADQCEPLGPTLRHLVERHPELEVRILVWSFAVIHAPSAPGQLVLGAPWQDHPRITVELDHEHPIYAAHHQKIVCIDDQIAFAGGIDLTVKRWDTWRHPVRDRRRTDPDGELYEPVQDLQMIVDGDAARAVAGVARMRWQIATGETLPPVDNPDDLWPTGLVPQFVDTDVAVARTSPGWGDQPAIGEIGRLTMDALKSARHCIYIEAQYFADFEVADLLADSLGRPEGPEIIVLMSHYLPGGLERFVMGRNRDRVLRRLLRADRHGRLGTFYPRSVAPDGCAEILVHAKLMIIDNDFLRVGSANINNRSKGLDTECDLAIEAQRPEQREMIAQIRRHLLAAHLHVEPDRLAATVEREGTMIGAIRALQAEGKGLEEFASVGKEGPITPVFGTGILDPKGPLVPRWLTALERRRQRAFRRLQRSGHVSGSPAR